MRIQTLCRYVLLFVLSTFLVACGSSGGDDVTVHTSTLTVGGKTVEGAKFRSTGGEQDTNGTTAANGQFTYTDNSTVEIRIGNTLLGNAPAASLASGLTMESLITAYTGDDPVIKDLAAILKDGDDAATPQITLPADLASLNPIRDAILTVNGKPASNVHYISVAPSNTTATRNITATDAFSDTTGNFEFDSLTNITFKIGTAVIGTRSGSSIPVGSTVTLESLIDDNSAAASNPTLSTLPTLLLVSQGTPDAPTHYELPDNLAALDPVAKTVLTLASKPISGVSFTSGSNTGLTTQNGVFEQNGTGSVTFKVADLTIGTVANADLPTSVEALVAANPSTYPIIQNLPDLLIGLNAAGASNPTASFRLHDLEQQLFKPDSLPEGRVLGMNLETPQAEADGINQPLITADIYRVSRPLEESSCNDISYDSNGWPLELPAACASADTANGESKYAFSRVLQYSTSQSVPAGTYTVVYDGKGVIHFSGMGCNRRLTNGVLLVDLAATNGCPNPIDSSLSGFNNGDNPRGLEISITQIDAADPIRNIRIIMPGGICKGAPFTRVNNATACGDTPYVSFTEVLKANRNAIVFNPDYLNFSKDFRVLRMMNLMEASPRRPESYATRNPCPAFPSNLADDATASQTTAYNAAVDAYKACVLQPLTWAQRPTLDHPSWGGSHLTTVRKRQGAPLEVGIALANLLEAHPWFNIPHNADDDYIEQYANLLADELDDSLIAHIEYSNEVWNSGFWGHSYSNFMGEQDSTISAMPNFPSRTAQYSKRTRYYAKRSMEVFTAFESEFSDNKRLKRILGGQHKNSSIIGHMLSYGTAAQQTDAVAIAPYFHGCWSRSTNTNCANTTTVPQVIAEAKSLDDIFAAIDGVYNNTPGIPDATRGAPDNLDGTIKSLKAQKAELDLITSREIDLYAYEGGQHLTVKLGDPDYTTAEKASLQDFMEAANRDPRMKDRYTTLLNGWKDAGAKLFVLFTAPQTFNRFGTFGIKEHLNSPRTSSPKYDGALTFQEALNGCWTGYVEDGC